MSWKTHQLDDAAVARLASALGVNAVTARCLTARGFDAVDRARAFLAPRLAELRRPDGLVDLERAIDRLVTAVTAGERVGCFGDYDVDGATTTALMTGFLRHVGVDCVPRLAERDAGYGFSARAADFFAEKGCKLVLVGDCGTNDVAAIEVANQLGLEVIVVDHHIPPANLADHPAYALINPLRSESTFPFHGMAAVGLGFYLMASLRTALVERKHIGAAAAPDMRDYLDLVALGTIADQVPLQGENRILAATGMRFIAQRRRPGLAALLEVSGVEAGAAVDEHTIAWKLAPRLNAPGRLGDAAPALELLLADDPVRARACAAELDQANQLRRAEQARVLGAAMAAVEEGPLGGVIVVGGRGWAHGVVGIVAANLAERYHRPAFVIGIDPETGEGRGSARSIAGVNLYELMVRCHDQFVRYGGHAGAGGFTVNAANIASLREALAAAVELPNQADGPCVDAIVELDQVDHELVKELSSLAPFGRGNLRPTLVCEGMRVTSSRRVGDGSHLKLELANSRGIRRSAIGFGLGESDPGVGALVDAAFAPVISAWNGQQRLELEIQQLAPTPVSS